MEFTKSSPFEIEKVQVGYPKSGIMALQYFPFQISAAITIAKELNPREVEYPWYGPWGLVLYSTFGNSKHLLIYPQYSLTRTIDAEKHRSQVPDFVVTFARTDGPVIMENKVVLIAEIKTIKSSWGKSDIDRQFRLHRSQFEKQAKYVFAKSMQRHVHGLLCIGDYWAHYRFERNMMSPLSESEDPEFIPDENKIMLPIEIVSKGRMGTSTTEFQEILSRIANDNDKFNV